MRLITHGYLDNASTARPAGTARRRPALIVVTWLGTLLVACPAFPDGIRFLPYFPAGLARVASGWLARWVSPAGSSGLLPLLSIGGLWLGYAACTGAVFASVRSRWFWLLYAILAFVLAADAAGCRFDVGQP